MAMASCGKSPSKPKVACVWAPGTLYSSIQTLLEEKFIEEVSPPNLGERRRYYRLTLAGRKLARAEAERLADLLRVARVKKILRGHYV